MPIPSARWLLVPLVAVLAACNASKMVEKLANPEKVQVARDYFEQLKSGDLDQLAAAIDPEVRQGGERANLQTMRALIPAGAPDSVELAGYHWRTIHNLSGSESTYSVTHQFRHGDKWLLVFVAWKEKGAEPRRITGLRVMPLRESLQTTHAFSFRNAGLVHYVFIVGVVAIPLYILATLIACARTRIPKRKWLWVVFILLGFVQVSLNWTTGETGVKFLHVQLLGAGFLAQPFGPWQFFLSVPLGALVFWVKRPQWLAAPPPSAEPPPLQSA